MNIEFLKPLWLLLLPLLFAFVLYVAWKGIFPSSFTKKLHTGVRLLVCTLLVLAMASPQFSRKTDETTTIFVVDRSASAEVSKGVAFLEEAYDAKGQKDRIAVISFGKTAGVEVMPALEGDFPTANFLSFVDAGATDIESALRLAAGIFPTDTAKRIVLLTDGEETQGDALKAANVLAGENIALDVVSLGKEEEAGVQLTALELPEVVNKKTAYDITLRLYATAETKAEVRLFKDNTLIAKEEITVSKGESRVVFSDQTEDGGGVTYRGEITPEIDDTTKNNQAYAYTYIDDVPQVLLLGEGEDTAAWKGILGSSGLQVETASAAGAPMAIDQLERYDSVVLANVSAKDLPEGFLPLLETYVRTLGGGLVVSGGENAYALGGYFDTPLAEMLPVDMELKTEGETPDLAMIMIIDRSGSMSAGAYGVTQLEMAKEAAIRSLDSFQEKDQVGILAFDDKFEWVVPMTKVVGNQQEITDKIGKIQLGGGTSILPGLTGGVKTLVETSAKEKHIILLTDGQAEQTGYGSVLEEMSRQGITLSSVAVGGGADTTLLKKLAKDGGGRYYFTNEFTDLPEIFATETLLAGKEYLNNRSFYPKAGDASALLSGVEAVPQLHGYVGTTAKSRGDMVLVSDKEEPILASWQYGLGRTVAWTPDVGGVWTKDWLGQSAGAMILRNAVGWVGNTQMSQEIRLKGKAGATSSTLQVEMPFDPDVTGLRATVLAADGTPYETALTASAPGVYEGVFATSAQGAYVAGLEMIKKDGTQTNVNGGFTLSYSAEYDMTRKGAGEGLLPQLAATAGGRVLTQGAEVFASQPQFRFTPKDMSSWFLWLGLGFFLLDIALRRFSGWSTKLAMLFSKKQQKTGKKEKPPKNVPVVEEKQKETEPLPKQEENVQNTMEKLASAKRKREKM